MSTTNQWWVNCCSTFNDSGPIYSVKLTCSSCPLFLTGLKPPRKSEDSECMWQLTAKRVWNHSAANNWQIVVLPQLEEKQNIMLTHQNWNYDSYDYYCFKSVPSRAKEYIVGLYSVWTVFVNRPRLFNRWIALFTIWITVQRISIRETILHYPLNWLVWPGIYVVCPSCPKKTACCVIIYEFSGGSADPDCKRRV